MIEHLYPESVETSGAYLESVLNKITQHQLAFTPITYTVWYEYVRGKNKGLAREVQAAENARTPVTHEMVLAWFKTHIGDHHLALADKKTRELHLIVEELKSQIDKSGASLTRHGNKLETYTDALYKTQSPKMVDKISKHILAETQSIISDSQCLKKEMDDTLSEMDALKDTLEGARQEARTDMLTGLLNRRGLEEAAARLFPASPSPIPPPLALIICDIDHFKRVNDTHGHLVGDSVLKLLSRLLTDQIKGRDIAARFGGEEFILILSETPLEGAMALAEQIRTKLKKIRMKTKSGTPIDTVTLSLGVAMHRNGESLETLIERADRALYQAKATGRDKSVSELDITVPG